MIIELIGTIVGVVILLKLYKQQQKRLDLMFTPLEERGIIPL
jgi:hypothetical protein